MRRQDASTGQIVETEDAAPAKQAVVKDKDLKLKVKIYSPFKVYYNDIADSISAENDTGPFDVLPKHHRFLTLLKPADIVVRLKDQEQRIRISRGIMHVRSDEVTVFLDV